MLQTRIFRVAVLIVLVAPSLAAAAEQGELANGWRGNGTGLWPQVRAPLEWRRIPHGAVEGLRNSADRPHKKEPGDATPVEKGLLRDWLVVGPFAVTDSASDLDKDLLGGESAIEPAAGETVAGQAWQRATVPPDDLMVFGTAELPWLDVVKVVGFNPNQVAYAHTYLHSPRGGPARIVVDHAHGMKAWLNGREVYRAPRREVHLGFYTSLSSHEIKHLEQASPRFEIELRPGWNRLLVKLSTSNKDDFREMRMSLRIMDSPDVPYETRNIAWMSELPGRSTSTPIIVGERLFVMAEPDELVCLDKNTGRILWTAANNFYEAMTPAERSANPAYAQRVDPLVAQLRAEKDRVRRVELRRLTQQALVEIDEKRFALHANDHFEAHFAIVGFTMPTPVSDGRHVFVWTNTGVAACYDLDGRRRWITRLDTDHLSYGSSPALADGVLAVFLDKLHGLDAATGELRWSQPRVHKNIAAVMAARLAGQNVFISQQGELIRPADGKLLYRPRGDTAGDTGWAPPVVLGETMFRPRYGVSELTLFEFAAGNDPAAREGEIWTAKRSDTISMPSEISRGPDGRWIDRWTAGSPLVWQGLVYQTDIYGVLYVADLETRRMLYRQDLGLAGYMHYNAVPVAASPTLVGGHILIMDNQGTTLVLEPGREFKVIGRNRIATQLDRRLPLPAQETLAYAPPIIDGGRLYLRGERHLYCVAND
jgi:outer membrane protein assembly factor BamB